MRSGQDLAEWDTVYTMMLPRAVMVNEWAFFVVCGVGELHPVPLSAMREGPSQSLLSRIAARALGHGKSPLWKAVRSTAVGWEDPHQRHATHIKALDGGHTI
jgi:hypothetical protein